MRHGRFALSLLLASLALLLAGCMSVPQQADRSFVERSVDIDGKPHRYQVFVPASAAGGRTPAVIVFLHGSGERGDDGDKPTRVGIGPYIRAHQGGFPAIVVFPQAPEGTEWSDNAALVFATLDAASREFHGDPQRTYLTGLSMGGYGTWDIALRQPKQADRLFTSWRHRSAFLPWLPSTARCLAPGCVEQTHRARTRRRRPRPPSARSHDVAEHTRQLCRVPRPR